MTSEMTSPPRTADAKQLGLPDIALVGKAGSGKTTGAELLVQLGYRRLSFANPLKSIAAIIWGEAARTDRDKLQRLGLLVRSIDPDAWVNLLLREYRDTSFGGQPIVIDDCRFPNEWDALKGEGFVMVGVATSLGRRIERLKANGKWQSVEQLGHASETALDDYSRDHYITNLDTVDDYYNELVDIVTKERRRR